MATLAENIKKTAAKFCLSLLFILGSAALCHAQGIVGAGQNPGLDVPGTTPIQSSAPALNGWECSDTGDIETIGVWDVLPAMDFASFSVAPVTPVTSATFSPDISPEPATLGLLPAGSAALFRFGWRKRSN